MSWRIKSRTSVTLKFYCDIILWNENSREFSVVQTHWWFDRFFDFGGVKLNYANLQETYAIASHVLDLFYFEVKSTLSNLV